MCDGDILIGESTAALSLIRATEGLGTNGVIVVNDSEGEHNHNGTIHIGAPSSPSSPFVYVGCIRIKDDTVDGSHGDNDGLIAVVGCLTDDINICVDGDDGTIRLTQTGCSPPYVDTCPSPPCGE